MSFDLMPLLLGDKIHLLYYIYFKLYYLRF